jgi:hypothetical protein
MNQNTLHSRTHPQSLHSSTDILMLNIYYKITLHFINQAAVYSLQKNSLVFANNPSCETFFCKPAVFCPFGDLEVASLNQAWDAFLCVVVSGRMLIGEASADITPASYRYMKLPLVLGS